MRRTLFLFVLAMVIVGCQSSDTGIYNKDAKDEALQLAKRDPILSAGEVVSVGPARERSECPQAPSERAGPCLEVEVTTETPPVRDMSGKPDAAGRKVRVAFEVFFWLKKNKDGLWEVTHKTSRPKGAAITR